MTQIQRVFSSIEVEDSIFHIEIIRGSVIRCIVQGRCIVCKLSLGGVRIKGNKTNAWYSTDGGILVGPKMIESGIFFLEMCSS